MKLLCVMLELAILCFFCLLPISETRSLAQYSPPWNETIYGREFDIQMELFDDVQALMRDFITFERYNIREFVVAMAFDSNHYNESLDAIASAQKFLKDRTIYVYDLGLKEAQIEELKRMCRVEVREIKWAKYPKHAQNLAYKAFKPIVVVDIMKDHPGVLWMDTSVRLTSKEFSKTFTQLNETMGILMLSTSEPAHSNFATTHEGMYTYLPTDEERMKQVTMRETGAMLIFKSKEVSVFVLWWWYHCAMTKGCIAPVNELVCDFKEGDMFKEYAGCHRFDQSAMNILLANRFDFDEEKYFSRKKLVEIHRQQTSMYEIQYCSHSEL